ncbi:MAG: isopentenyl-diphosphate Delta-isomerase [Hyphomicrobiaceae bacterium]|nr:isopentenyl-diphosphate Delta-isomerase [Hyphomicrobiaceae bacterium]
MRSREDGDIIIPAIASDGTLYPVGKLEAHRLGLLHVAISVFVFDRDGRLLIQRRAAGKYHSGGQWANTCCSHPDWGEDIAASAHRRMREELGLETSLSQTRTIEYRADVGAALIEHERVHVFRGSIDASAVHLDLDPAEVSETAWIVPADLMRQARVAPEALTPWLRIYLERWSELGLD